ncbi:MAG TPA: cyclopropane-fatty-acyl-phospholipid synthase family protein [Geminicoccaceae bacterium]|nr:cyclopropane-fatty-acyl-phospholipid synthase family protein [Geminicoccus sp.]HMU49744.1 cyclopropane-fatty-acyl-phospholipid synthase family protein [Geminicoccaceae bacterium]
MLLTTLRRLIRVGQLTLIDAQGTIHVFGRPPGPEVTIRLADRRLLWKLALIPDPTLGEAVMDGRLVIERGSIYDLVDLCAANVASAMPGIVPRLVYAVDLMLRRLHQFNPIGRSRDNVAHHYDLDGRLYDLFLDRDRQYSCAYFAWPEMGLEEAQAAKKRHIASKLLLRPGMRVLDIGSGWGGLALTLAAEHGCDVTGLTLSREQHAYATARAARAGLSDRVRFHLQDYREVRQRFDRIVSVGMLEHVGVNHLGRYFARVSELLEPEGVALIHSIGRMAGPAATSRWIRKYIFPGGYIPALSEVTSAVERSGMWATDIEILRLHYAMTLRQWRERFLAHRDIVASRLDERFCRMWEFYLAASEAFFRRQDGMVFQIQLAKRRDTVPLTRDYMARAELVGRRLEPIAAE